MTNDTAVDAKGERIAKVLARAGVASRRDIERMIEQGRVSVNGKMLTHPAFIVTSDHQIMVDGKMITAKEPTRLWRYNKPAGLIVAARDPQGRPTIFEHLPKNLPRVISVGRLDLTSEGLLLLTNDGEMARFLESPQQGFLRRYRVRVHVGSKGLDEEKLSSLKHGVTIDGVDYRGLEVEKESLKGSNAWLIVGIREGKNREVRKVMEHLGYIVSRLIRIGFGPFQLAKLDVGQVEEIPARAFKDLSNETREAPEAKAHAGTITRSIKIKSRERAEPRSIYNKPVRPEKPKAEAREKYADKFTGQKGQKKSRVIRPTETLARAERERQKENDQRRKERDARRKARHDAPQGDERSERRPLKRDDRRDDRRDNRRDNPRSKTSFKPRGAKPDNFQSSGYKKSRGQKPRTTKFSGRK